MNKILKNKAIVASLIVIALFLVSTLVYFSYSKNQDIILGSRGSLPYYDYVYSVLGSEIENRNTRTRIWLMGRCFHSQNNWRTNEWHDES